MAKSQQNENIKRYLTERKTWLDYLIPMIKPGWIAEMGCGSGFVIEFIARKCPDCRIVGIDVDLDRLHVLSSKNLKKVIPVCADVRNPVFTGGSFDTVLIISTLHIVFSQYGDNGVIETLRLAREMLTGVGRLIIQDFLKPDSETVQLMFNNNNALDRFYDFCREFRPRSIRYKSTNQSVRLDIADAIDFLAKYQYTGNDWSEEMGETHYFYSVADFNLAARQTGFKVADVKKWKKKVSGPISGYPGLECDFNISTDWIQVVLEKVGDD
jgi:ubiquinone/menaquinone biosynthesis C-methylase UbiE